MSPCIEGSINMDPAVNLRLGPLLFLAVLR